MQISARIVADSINPCGNRLTTVVVTFPRFILPQVLTHRMFSRNTSSSRAIPTKRLLERLRNDPAEPLQWMLNKRGMQPAGPASDDVAAMASGIWHGQRDGAYWSALDMSELGIAKEQVNRLLEPFLWTGMIISATEWDNFFRLRIHGDAQNEIRVLAQAIKDAMDASTPDEVSPMGWHLPFIDCDWVPCNGYDLDDLIMISTARCARVSYYLPGTDKMSDYESDLRLYEKLLSDPPHASAFEHQAMALASPERVGNFVGWVQHRKFIVGESA